MVNDLKEKEKLILSKISNKVLKINKKKINDNIIIKNNENLIHYYYQSIN